MKLLLTFAFAGLLAAAPICSFECLSPGAANQSVCGPVADRLFLDYDETTSLVTFTHAGYNGTVAEEIMFTFQSAMTTVFDILVHSNGGTWSANLPESPVGAIVAIRGIGGPDRTTLFSADCSDCGHTPEPRGQQLAGLLVLAGGMVLAGRRR